jgi:hypothetical protein
MSLPMMPSTAKPPDQIFTSVVLHRADPWVEPPVPYPIVPPQHVMDAKADDGPVLKEEDDYEPLLVQTRDHYGPAVTDAHKLESLRVRAQHS